MHNANSERLSERLSTQSIKVFNRMYLERNIYIYIYIIYIQRNNNNSIWSVIYIYIYNIYIQSISKRLSMQNNI